MNQQRRTKIIVTLGPAILEPSVLREVILAGTDVIRVNFSHGTTKNHVEDIKLIRQLSRELKTEIAICADLQGPKIRIACFTEHKVTLQPGQSFRLDMALDHHAGTQYQVGCDYQQLIQDVQQGDTLLLDDGRLVLKVKSIVGSQIDCDVEIGGELSDHKGINRLGGGLSAPAITEKDKVDLIAAVKAGVDYIAISFPRSAADIEVARELIRQAGGEAGIIAKIERTEAVKAIDEIIQASDAVMVARGDLGVEIGEAEVPGVQKMIISRARALNRVVITATQMMESMIHQSSPTRAEVSDVANAVLDGTDAVMLSAETAVGAHPLAVIKAMSRICLSAEKNPLTQSSKHRVECHFERPDEAIAMAAMYTANHLDIAAIASLTESGTTPLWMSRIRSGIPIFALTRHLSTVRKLMLYRGVYPVLFDVTQINAYQLDQEIAHVLKKQGFLQPNEAIIITRGDITGIHGYTNSMKIYYV